MATRTIAQARALDHLYDPNYATSHPVDHHRLTTKAIIKPENWERVPDHKYMFSELSHYPRQNIRLKDSGEIPDTLDRNWHPPSAVTSSDAYDVGGKYRHRFHRRPLAAAPVAHITMYEVREERNKVHVVDEVDEPTRTIGTQSIYRESEAQTDPYSPEHVLPVNAVPEILTLTHLTYGAGLPAALSDIQIIERTRQKRIFENMLPPSTDEFSYGLRSRLMEAKEIRAWAEREKQIEELQNQRLKILKEALQEKDALRLKAGEQKVDRLKKKRQNERDCVLTGLQRRRVKVLRQAFKMKQVLEVRDNARRKEIIAEHSDYTSHLYAPKMRDGYIPETNTAKIEVQPSDLNSYADLVQLERTLPAHMLRVDIESKLQPEIAPRKTQIIHNALREASERLNIQNAQSIEGGTQDDAAARERRDRNMLERAETPRIQEDVLPEEEDLEMGVLLLQRMLRGRAAQNKMFEGKEKRLDLINELRTAEQAVDQVSTAEDPLFTEEAKRAIVENIQGTVVAQTLDELSKELGRFHEERRIAVMVKLAERDRRLRQAQESGRRQAEERLREREDEMFRQIMGVHQGTMDSYLEDIITATVDEAAKSGAIAEAHLQAEKINKMVDIMESQDASSAHEVRDLVGSFVLPHVPREIVQRRVKSIDSRKYRQAAWAALEDSMTQLKKTFEKQTPT